jgi:lactoylglutathione lyase
MNTTVDLSSTPYSKDIIDGLKQQNIQWQQSMLRVKDPQASINFYQQHFGMTLCQEYHFGEAEGNFSLYFLTTVKTGDAAPPTPGSPEADTYLWDAKNGRNFLELTWNHGTETIKEDEMTLTDHAGRKQVYHNGNTAPRGFGCVRLLFFF